MSLLRIKSYNKSIDKNTWVKVNDKTELDTVNLPYTDRLFSPDSHFGFSSIMPKNRFRFLRSHFCTGHAEEIPEL